MTLVTHTIMERAPSLQNLSPHDIPVVKNSMDRRLSMVGRLFQNVDKIYMYPTDNKLQSDILAAAISLSHFHSRSLPS